MSTTQKRFLSTVLFSILGLSIVNCLPISAQIVPFQDGTIPKEQKNKSITLPINQYQNTIFIEGVMMYYTDNRFNLVTRFKSPTCEGGTYDADFFVKAGTDKGYLTTPRHIIQTDEQGKTSEHTFSTFGYFGELEKVKIEIFVRSDCFVKPTSVQTPIQSLPETKIDNIKPLEKPALPDVKIPVSNSGIENKIPKTIKSDILIKPNVKLAPLAPLPAGHPMLQSVFDFKKK
jgi:hypothetical protein